MSDSKKNHNPYLEGFAMLTLCGSSNYVNKQEDLRYLLSPNEETIIGRSPECKIAVDPERYSTVSRYHARICLVTNNSQPTWEIYNLSVTNGTYINGKQIKESHILQPGDKITLSWDGPELLFEYQSLQITVPIQSQTSTIDEQEVSATPALVKENEAAISTPTVGSSAPITPFTSAKEETPTDTGLLVSTVSPESVYPVIVESQLEAEISISVEIDPPAVVILSSVESQLESEANIPPPALPVVAKSDPEKSEQELETEPSVLLINSPVEPISSSAFSNQIFSTLAENGRSLWNVGKDNKIITFSSHSNLVRAVAFSSDGQILASASVDKTVKLWSVNTGEEVSTFAGHKSQVNAVAFSPDGQMLASGSSDKTVKLWNINTSQEICSLLGHALAVNAVAFSPNGQTLVSASSDKTVKLWNISTGEEIRSLSAYKMGVNAVAFSPDGQTLVSGSSDKTVKLWNINTGEEISSLPAQRSSVTTLLISPDGQSLAICTDDKMIKLWNLTTGEEIYTLCGYSWQIGAIAISPDGQTLASGSQDKTIKFWRL
ncbi:FHA domain-containing protein [Nostoc sphaeroides]|nr:FHA domain-containing protein [Nostoc sphaeroides]